MSQCNIIILSRYKVVTFFFLVLTQLVSVKSYAQKDFQEVGCISQMQKTCVEESEKVIEGYRVKKCWKYKEVFRCTGEEENYCAPFEDNRGCNEINGKCIAESPTGLCNILEKKFVCGHKNNNISGSEVVLVDQQFNVLRDEKDFAGCDPQIKNKYCEVTSETCLQPKETRNINGKDVYKDCWKWDRKYQCRTDTAVNECALLSSDKDCREISRECIHQEEGRCEHYVVRFECDNTKTEKIDCIASQFCVGDICQEQQRNTNSNFGLAASYLGVLSQVNKDQDECTCNKETDPSCDPQNIQESKCRLFRGGSKVCRKYTSQFNCCSDKGVFRPLVGCNDQEKELASKQQAGACVYVDSWRGKGLKKFQKKKTYCCFNSKLARIIQEQGRRQLGKGWGSFKAPDCSALTLAEIKSIDFSQVDFSELYAELKDKATQDFGVSSKAIQNQLESYKDNPDELAGLVKNKMRSFYEK